ncbi:MAG: DUF6858 family protein [Pseudomonadota bacterium]
MEQTHFDEKYPVYEARIEKNETSAKSCNEVLERLKAAVESDKRTKFIGEFDHLAHTRNIGGEIAEGILAAGHVVFCFGMKLPNARVMAVRPRSIGVTEFDDHFIVNFLEPPMPVATEAMENWVKALRDA